MGSRPGAICASAALAPWLDKNPVKIFWADVLPQYGHGENDIQFAAREPLRLVAGEVPIHRPDVPNSFCTHCDYTHSQSQVVANRSLLAANHERQRLPVLVGLRVSRAKIPW